MVQKIEPPYSQESEMMVLGCMLTNLDSLNIAAANLDESDFYFGEHKILFQVLKRIHKRNKPADVHIVCEELKKQGQLEAVAYVINDEKISGAAYITTLAQYAGTSAYIEEYVEIVKSKSTLRKAISIARDMEKTVCEGPRDVHAMLDEIVQKIESIQESDIKYVFDIQPYSLENLRIALSQTKEGLKTGYTELDDMVRIPNEAITLIGGRPSHGKTTFMLNLFLNLIHQYTTHHFYFFSYEETCQQIAVKIINILSGWVFNEAQNLNQLEGYIRGGHTSYEPVEKGKEIYQELVDSGRLRIIGEPYHVQELSLIIKSLKSKVPLGAVFIDYIQKIKNKQRFGTRQLELANTSSAILEIAKKYSIPTILGAQLGRDKESRDKVKLDNLREAGDLENDANLVIGIFNPAMEKAHDEQRQLVDRKVDLKITPLKNRNGVVNKTVTLEFDRPILKIRSKK